MIRSFLFAALFVGAALSGACLTPSARDLPIGVDLLVYQVEEGSQCSPCAGLRITLAMDGRMWVKQRLSKPPGRGWRDWPLVRLPPSLARRVWDLLEPYRPAEQPNYRQVCEDAIPGQTAVFVSWQSPGRRGRALRYSGCDPEANRELRSRLNQVPAMLGLRGAPSL